MIKQQGEAKNSLPPEYNSFSLYLKADSHNEKILKWYILDTTLQESEHKFRLRDLKNSPRLLKILENRISSLSKTYSLSNLVLSPEEDRRLDAKLAEYLNELPKVIDITFIVDSCVHERWMDFATALKMLTDTEKNPGSYFMKLARDTTKVSLLIMALKIEYLVKQQKWERLGELQQLLDIILAVSKGFFKQDDIFQNQTSLVIAELINFGGDKLPPNVLQLLKDSAYRFKTTFNIAGELDKLVKDYVPKELQDRLASMTSETSNPYRWQNIDDNSPSATLKRNFEKFKDKYKVFVDLHNALYQNKQVIKHEDRLKHNFYFTENILH